MEARYADWHPHFTPGWLSERMASYLPRSFEGTIVDPACGAGNLLAAAALQARGRSMNSRNLSVLGIDVSARAVRACRENLSDLLPDGNVRVERADFLRFAEPFSKQRMRTAVVMNPPFKGYGQQSPSLRRQVTRLLGMRGRFNLSHAFVLHAVRVFRPYLLVSLLPSTWMYSKASRFTADLGALGGSWDWENVGDFQGVSAHVGILVWRSRKRHGRKTSARTFPSLGDLPGVEVLHGAATGRDKIFIELASQSLPIGDSMTAVRGRDVARKSRPRIWVPPSSPSPVDDKVFRRHLASAQLISLGARTCVTGKRARLLHQYHDAIPGWFRAGPKLLLPEIVTREVRVEFDLKGTTMPLHSVIAIRVPSVLFGRRLKKHLLEPSQQKALLSRGPPLSSGAIRIQVSALKDLRIPRALLKWKRKAGLTG